MPEAPILASLYDLAADKSAARSEATGVSYVRLNREGLAEPELAKDLAAGSSRANFDLSAKITQRSQPSTQLATHLAVKSIDTWAQEVAA